MASTDTRSPGEGRRSGPDLDPPTTVVRMPGPLDPPTTAMPAQRPVPAGGPAQPVSTVMQRWLAPALALAAVALLPVAAATTDLTALDGWGLALVLPPVAWAALLCAVAACLAEIWSPRPRIPMLATATGVLVLCTVGMPSVVQPAARFSTAWLIAGFTDALVREGGVPPQDIDARFSWPAFFAQWAFFREAGGAQQLDTVLRWFPPVVVAVWAIGIYALARSMLGGNRAPWVAAWLFVGLNWIEQDYFSPQALGIVILLTVLTFVLGPLATRRTDAAGVPGWPAPHPDAPRLPLWRRWLVSARTPPNRPTLPPRQLLLIYACVALCVIAVAAEHQLTPIAIIGQLVVLAVVGRFRGRGLVLVAFLAFLVYFLIGAREIWTNQIHLIIGDGDSGAALEAGVEDRLKGDTGQVVVKYLRILVPGLTWLLAIAGAWVYWRRRRDLVPIALAVVPMGFAAQGYGGEVFLRIVLYGLPVLTILGADALRWLARRNRGWEKVLALGMVGLFPLLVLIRGGNDAFQAVTPQEVALARQTIQETPPDDVIVPLIKIGPYGLEGIGIFKSDALDYCEPTLMEDPVDCIITAQPDVLLVNTSMEKMGQVLEGKPVGWTLEVVQQLVASGQYVLTYQDGYDAVVKKVPPPVLEPVPAPVPGG